MCYKCSRYSDSVKIIVVDEAEFAVKLMRDKLSQRYGA